MVNQKPIIATVFLLVVAAFFWIASPKNLHSPELNQQTLGAKTTAPATPEPSLPPQKNTFPIVSVVDGDTLKVNIDGSVETIRIVGINTPETVDPRKQVECFGKEASTALKLLLVGKAVVLEMDPTQSDRDRYGRLLRFIFLDGQDVGLAMIKDGFAQEALYSTTPHKYQPAYLQAQAEAQAAQKGLWAVAACVNKQANSKLAPSPTASPTTNPPRLDASRNCSGPDLDCSDFITREDVRAFFSRCGFTAQNDPMNLDAVGVGDGVACESLPSK